MATAIASPALSQDFQSCLLRSDPQLTPLTKTPAPISVRAAGDGCSMQKSIPDLT